MKNPENNFFFKKRNKMCFNVDLCITYRCWKIGLLKNVFEQNYLVIVIFFFVAIVATFPKLFPQACGISVDIALAKRGDLVLRGWCLMRQHLTVVILSAFVCFDMRLNIQIQAHIRCPAGCHPRPHREKIKVSQSVLESTSVFSFAAMQIKHITTPELSTMSTHQWPATSWAGHFHTDQKWNIRIQALSTNCIG